MCCKLSALATQNNALRNTAAGQENNGRGGLCVLEFAANEVRKTGSEGA